MKNEEMVKINFLEDESIILAALGVKISQTPFEKGSIKELYQECLANREEAKRLVNEIMRKHRHLILADFLPYAITLENISRLAAIYFWRNVNANNLVFGAGIEASLRVIKPNRYNQIVSDLGKTVFKIYQKAINLGVQEQDARYLLPEGTLTRLIFSAPPRYLIKMAHSLKNAPLSELKQIGEKIGILIKEKFGLEIPKESLPSQWKFWSENCSKEKIEEKIYFDYNGKTHSISLNMRAKGSLAMYAQLVRQRQILCDIEPLEKIAKKGSFVVPSSFPEELRKDYKKIAKEAKRLQTKLIEKRDPNFVYFLLMGQEAGAMIYGKGFPIIETSRARSEGVAQWEIRNKVGIPITEELAKYQELRKEIGPRCWREKRCIEPETFKTKKAICKAFEKARGNWQGTLEELLETLREPSETFIV
ncbi:MAG: FAD-dependent thymidylate synthase [Patescibacteria group bacterium]|nr:FAD-dependent thymidylate synthase [Patescibacteria group bacterium]